MLARDSQIKLPLAGPANLFSPQWPIDHAYQVIPLAARNPISCLDADDFDVAFAIGDPARVAQTETSDRPSRSRHDRREFWSVSRRKEAGFDIATRSLESSPGDRDCWGTRAYRSRQSGSG